MTEINDFLQKVNKTPSFLTEVDWCIETNWFDKGSIKKIISGIKDDEVCEIVVDYITEEWYVACECKTDMNEYNLKDRDESYNYNWRFNPKQESNSRFESIEEFLIRLLDKRSIIKERRKKLNSLDDKVNKLHHFYCFKQENDRLKNTIEKLNEELKTENADLKTKLQQSIDECNNLEEALSVCHSELLDKERDRYQISEDIRNEAIREFVQQLIIFAESYPSNQNDKAEVIKQALLVKEHNGFIPSSVLDEKWNERLMNLGRKEPPGLRVDNITANNLYDIHNNGEVKL